MITHKGVPNVFHGYCFTRDGQHTPAVKLVGVQEVHHYLSMHGRSGVFKRVIATDCDDYIVAEIEDGKFTFPSEWKRLNH